MKRFLTCLLMLGATWCYAATVTLNGKVVTLNGKAVDLTAGVVQTYYVGETLANYFNKTNAAGFICVDGVSVLTNNPNMSTGATQTNFVPGNYTGMSVKLDGVDDYLNGPRRTPNGATAMTYHVDCWSTNYAKTLLLFGDVHSTVGTWVHGFQQNATGTQLFFRVVGTTNGTAGITNTARARVGVPLSTGVWHCLIGTWHSNQIPQLYIDGIVSHTNLDGTLGMVLTNSAFSQTTVGYGPAGGVYFPGYLANAWMTNIYISSNTAYNLATTHNL